MMDKKSTHDISNCPQSFLQTLQQNDNEALFETDKRKNRLRWLAFYYLSKRELSRYELQQKLLAKDFALDEIVPLLDDFAQSNYQSDERFVAMTVKECLRRGRGMRYIAQKLRQAKVVCDNLNACIDQAVFEYTDHTQGEDTQGESACMDWLALAVATRTKKYGTSIPKDPKEKARQFRFLQSRGFETSICFEALKHA